MDADTVIGIIEVMKLMNSVPAGIAGDVYAKFDPGEPGLFRNAVRQLSVVLVKVPVELMYLPRLSLIATWA